MESTPRKIRVCIVEDNQFVNQKLASTIQRSDACILLSTYSSAEAAINNLCKEVPDVVLMDIDLEKESGIVAIKKLKEKCPSIQYMMCTVHEEDEKIFEALAAGANGYILKNIEDKELIDAIIDLADGGAPMSSKIAKRVVASFQQKEARIKENGLETLSAREFELLELLVKGFLYKEIADKLNIAQETVRKHVYNIYKKLHVNNRVEAYHKFYGS